MSVRQSLILPPMGPHLRWVLSTFLSENKIQDNKRNTKMMKRMISMMVLVMKMTMMIRRRRMTMSWWWWRWWCTQHSVRKQDPRQQTSYSAPGIALFFPSSFLFLFFSFSFLFFIFTLFILTFIQIRFKNTKFSPHTLISPIALDFIFELSFRIGEGE